LPAGTLLGVGSDPLYSAATSSATATGTLFSVNTDGVNAIMVQVTSAGTTCTITYESSNDGVNWVAQPALTAPRPAR